MADYFSEYSTFIGHKGLPSPADTPYETPAFLRSKRSSRATTVGSKSRDHSSSPPPLPPSDQVDHDKNRNGQFTALDPRRFTPTLHASLVAEILSLRRDLDSKNHLVENLESSLAAVKDDNDLLNNKLVTSAKDVRVAKSQVQQMESGTYEALETLAAERNSAQSIADEMRSKLEIAQKKVKLQDADAERTQAIWEREKESWENERRQLERRVHVTETRLRTFVDEMVTHQSVQSKKRDEVEEVSAFTDSGLGQDDSDDESAKQSSGHKRVLSHASFNSNKSRASVQDSPMRNLVTPEPISGATTNLADELDFADDAETELDDAEYANSVYGDVSSRTFDSRQSISTPVSKAKRVLGLSNETPTSPRSSTKTHSEDEEATPTRSTRREKDLNSSPSTYGSFGAQLEAARISIQRVTRVQYVDTGYQPSPPCSPKVAVANAGIDSTETSMKTKDIEAIKATPKIVVDAVPTSDLLQAQFLASNGGPLSLLETPVGVVNQSLNVSYCSTSTQTEAAEVVIPKDNRQSLSLPTAVPSIAIHPPTSRPSSPRPYVLPPHTKNATTQADFGRPGVDASVQTEEIRIDRRPVKLPPHLLPSYLAPLPDPTNLTTRDSIDGVARLISSKTFPVFPAVQPPAAPQTESKTPALSRDNDRSMPLKAICLPKPTLAPAYSIAGEVKSQGPLHRSAQFGVTENSASRLLAAIDDSDSDTEESGLVVGRRPSQVAKHPRNVPEDKELSPDRRPMTTDSNGPAPAPSIASSRDWKEQQRLRKRPPPKLNTYTNLRSRSPSFGSVASSASQGLPPFPIPTRSSSRQVPNSHSEGSYSPTDRFVPRPQHTRQRSLRKVQSSSSIRRAAQSSPRKGRRRLRSPDLTPVQSMAFESPAPTAFPIPELPTPLQRGPGSDYRWGSGASGNRPDSTIADESGLVDAIAATMVGEWMWKYIRKRKSFGVGESTEDFTPAQLSDLSSIGTRHKRWVWLSPYERTIMWDSKQPMSGSALLGKKGRKLTIQSVIDVKDDTPLAKKPELESAFARSILILTPARALKFTTTSAERHALWMTALTFLAESNRMEASLPPLPLAAPPQRAPPPPPPPIHHSKSESPSFGRANIRDSVRLAKGKQDYDHASARIDSVQEGADFPAIPRLYSSTTRHQRKRSNTSPRLPPPLNNLRSFSSSAASSSSATPYRFNPPSTATSKSNVAPAPSSHSGSRGNSVAGPEPNFFEAMGTVRMEAFVDPNVKNGVLYVPALPGTVAAAANQMQPRGSVGRCRGESTTTIDKRRASYIFDDDGVDPFKGF